VSESPFQSLLLPDETVYWSAEAAPFISPNFGSGVFAVLSLSFVGLGLYPIMAVILGSLPAPEPSRYLGPIASILFGLFSFWVAISDKAVLPRTRFMLTQRRALVARAKKLGWETTARFIESGRAVQVVETGKHFELSIPVKPEDPRDNGFMKFHRLSKADCDAALVIVNKVIGISAQ
jgi:hypothetical protein